MPIWPICRLFFSQFASHAPWSRIENHWWKVKKEVPFHVLSKYQNQLHWCSQQNRFRFVFSQRLLSLRGVAAVVSTNNWNIVRSKLNNDFIQLRESSIYPVATGSPQFKRICCGHFAHYSQLALTLTLTLGTSSERKYKLNAKHIESAFEWIVPVFI